MTHTLGYHEVIFLILASLLALLLWALTASPTGGML